MARVLFKRGTTEEIEALPTEDGAFIVDTEKGKSYTDVGSKRIPVGSAGNEVVIGDEEQITEDTKLFINPDEVLPQGNDVVDSLEGNETDKAPSVRAVKDGLKDVYSTEEKVIGTWLGKTLYRKVIDFGTLPNATSKNVLTGLQIGNINIVNYYGAATGVDNIGKRYSLTLPDIDPNGPEQATRLTINTSGDEYNVVIKTGIDRSNMYAYIVIEYTKTTD